MVGVEAGFGKIGEQRRKHGDRHADRKPVPLCIGGPDGDVQCLGRQRAGIGKRNPRRPLCLQIGKIGQIDSADDDVGGGDDGDGSFFVGLRYRYREDIAARQDISRDNPQPATIGKNNQRAHDGSP